MNFKKFINSDYLKSNPLCGIGTYKDTLDLSNGSASRYVKKLVLDGTEIVTTITDSSLETGTKVFGYYYTALDMSDIIDYNVSMLTINYPIFICSHFTEKTDAFFSYKAIKNGEIGANSTAGGANVFLIFASNQYTTEESWKSWLAQQYANGTPVTVWYILSTPTTETITVPSGLSGTEEGYLIQDGTPTPTNPIYPTANTVEKWFDSPHYIMGTSTDTITTLPDVVYVNDTTATVGLKGNMSQTGTPTPDNPIMPQGTGERTGNLFDLSAYYNVDSGITNISIDNGAITYNASSVYLAIRYKFNLSVSDIFTIGLGSDSEKTQIELRYLKNNTQVGQKIVIQKGSYQVISGGDAYDAFSIYISNRASTGTCKASNIMLNTGSTALPYEPYGYKIPISSANITTPVYLGEVESTRQIKKLVLTGEENWNVGSANYYTRLPSDGRPYSTALCTHAKNASTIDNNGAYLYLQKSTFVFETLTDFKSYLAAQYTNGTPVTVWYILATETTGIVNEPLMKIGDYADEVSGITIPTIAGENTISVGTTLQPSEVTVNYKGWHPVADVHERENGAWD